MRTLRTIITKTGRIITKVDPVGIGSGDILRIYDTFGHAQYQVKINDIAFNGYKAYMGDRRRYWKIVAAKDIEKQLSMYEQAMIAEVEISKIINVVCAYFDIFKEDLMQKTRKREIIDARHIATALANFKIKDKRRVSLAFIGKLIGRKDHATVLHASKKVLNLCETDPVFKAMYDHVETLVNKELLK